MKYYLAYGSNLNMRQMRQRCPDAMPISSAVILDYRLLFRRGVATIEPMQGASVPVGIWKISASDEKALDRYEGYPWLYTKRNFKLRMNGKIVAAMAYIMTDGHEVSGPREGYLETIKKGYDCFGFDYGTLIEAVRESEGRRLL
ncbi:MAG: gamma-glutamylcyclotransferase [Clostridia bacterium]|nr:gamma-glutamylcyclotransferase [Clostridia bacterium]